MQGAADVQSLTAAQGLLKQARAATPTCHWGPLLLQGSVHVLEAVAALPHLAEGVNIVPQLGTPRLRVILLEDGQLQVVPNGTLRTASSIYGRSNTAAC